MAQVRPIADAEAARNPTTELLLAIANELAGLERAGAMLQDLVAGKVRSGALSGMALLDAQGADLLVQQLGELSRFLTTYAKAIRNNAADPLTTALDGVLLSALSRRLASNPEDENPPASGPASGEVEMF